MTSQAYKEKDGGGEKRFSRCVTRIKKFLIRRVSKKNSPSLSSSVEVALPPSRVEPSAPTIEPLPGAIEPLIQPPLEADPLELPMPSDEETQAITVLRSHIDADRARRLGERFNMSKQLNEWNSTKPEKELIRVHKPILVRVRRNCHQCNTAFGASKVCSSCDHNRCNSCPRYPPKKDKDLGSTSNNNRIKADNTNVMEPDFNLTIPSRTGGQALVRRRPKQRIRRTCHECNTLFRNDSKLCPGCNHRRCVDCPRDPAKRELYPDGYPGDAPSSTSTAPIKYNCHQCNRTYPPVPHPNSPEGLAMGDAAEPLECSRCGHLKCDACVRAPPRKIVPAHDPEVLKSLEAKLADLRLHNPPVLPEV